MYAGNQQLGDIWTDLTGAFQSGAQLVQAVRQPAPGTTPLYPAQYAPQPIQQAPRSILSDPMTLTLIALGGLAVLLLILKR